MSENQETNENNVANAVNDIKDAVESKVEEITDEIKNASKEKAKPKKKAAKPKDDEEEGEEEDDAAGKIIDALGSGVKKIINFFMGCIKFILGLIGSVVRLVRNGLGTIFGFAFFLACSYLLRHYVLEDVDIDDLRPYDSKMNFLLRCVMWAVLPVCLATAVSAMRPLETHKTFAHEKSEQALLFLFNLLLASTHMEPECLVYARSVSLVYAAFSMLNWFCMVYTKKRGNLFGHPLKLFNFTTLAYNICSIMGQDLGYFDSADHASTSTQTEGGGWFS